MPSIKKVPSCLKKGRVQICPVFSMRHMFFFGFLWFSCCLRDGETYLVIFVAVSQQMIFFSSNGIMKKDQEVLGLILSPKRTRSWSCMMICEDILHVSWFRSFLNCCRLSLLSFVVVVVCRCCRLLLLLFLLLLLLLFLFLLLLLLLVVWCWLLVAVCCLFLVLAGNWASYHFAATKITHTIYQRVMSHIL